MLHFLCTLDTKIETKFSLKYFHDYFCKFFSLFDSDKITQFYNNCFKNEYQMSAT